MTNENTSTGMKEVLSEIKALIREMKNNPSSFSSLKNIIFEFAARDFHKTVADDSATARREKTTHLEKISQNNKKILKISGVIFGVLSVIAGVVIEFMLK